MGPILNYSSPGLGPCGRSEVKPKEERDPLFRPFLAEKLARDDDGPSARKTSQWLVFSEAGQALACPRTHPELLRRSEERFARRFRDNPTGQSFRLPLVGYLNRSPSGVTERIARPL